MKMSFEHTKSHPPFCGRQRCACIHSGAIIGRSLRASPGKTLLRHGTPPAAAFSFSRGFQRPTSVKSQHGVTPTSTPSCGASWRVPTPPRQMRLGETYKLHVPIRSGGSTLLVMTSCQSFLASGSTMPPCCGVHIARGYISVRGSRS